VLRFSCVDLYWIRDEQENGSHNANANLAFHFHNGNGSPVDYFSAFISGLKSDFGNSWPTIYWKSFDTVLIVHSDSGNQVISKLLSSESNFFVGRFGAVESSILFSKYDSVKGSHYSFRLRKSAWANAGVWPPTTGQLNSFADKYLSALRNTTALAVWPPNLLAPQADIIKKLDRKIIQIPISSLDVVHTAQESHDFIPWTMHLSGLNVLIVHPMAESIVQQYKNYKVLHAKTLLPKFNLFTFIPPQTQGAIFWRDSYDKQLQITNERISKILSTYKIDVALIAAGAYGMPIANGIFSEGSSAIYVGGALQLLFGIMGGRWRNSDAVNQMITQHWLESSLEKPPFGGRLVEKRTYW
jgi:hypothetical protein